MRIIMIGHSNVGKTTYMASMYGAMQDGVNGFTLRTAFDDDHDRFLALHKATRGNHYPSATDQRAQYDFTLNFDDSPVFEFTWVDRRGGAILERSTSSESQELLDDLRWCDGLLVFCDAAAAVGGDEDANEMERISQLLGKAMEERYLPMPVGLVLTKSDLVSQTDTRRLDPLRPLIETLRRSDLLTHAVIEVACGPAERNVAAPVLFAVRHGGLGDAESAIWRELNDWQSAAARHNKDADDNPFMETVTDLFGGLFGAVSSREKARIANENASRSRQQWSPLWGAVESLDEYLSAAIKTT